MSAFTSEHHAAVQHLFYGHEHVPNKSDFGYSWKAVKAVAAGDGVLSQAERRHLLGRMCVILTPPDVIEEVMRFDEHSEAPERLAAQILVPDEVRPGTGAWIVYNGLSVALSDGDLAARELDAVRRVAATMRVPTETVDALVQLCRDEDALRTRRMEVLNATIPTAFRFIPTPQTQPQARTGPISAR